MKLWGNIKIWIRKREDILRDYLCISVWLIVVIIAFLLYIFGQLDLLTLVPVVLCLIASILPIFFYIIKKRDQTILISFTSKYLLEKEESKIDELLGILIAGKWEKLKIDPVEEFFNCLKRMCKKSDFEMRRRIAEALPALFKIDLKRSKEIIEILRQDWDEGWKSDNRRRTIEALSYIAKEEKDFVRENLQIIHGDEIFAIIAIVEILDVWKEKINSIEAEELVKKLTVEMKGRNYKDDEISAVSELWDLLNLIHYNPNQSIKKFEELKDIPNIYVQICIARNLKHLCKKFPEKMLDLMEYFMREDKHKNVRRPIAKEDSVECLISLLRGKQLCEKAKNIIWKLINDEDYIIRLATFDKIEKILDINSEFGSKIIQHVIEKNRHPKLVERAKNLLSRDRD